MDTEAIIRLKLAGVEEVLRDIQNVKAALAGGTSHPQTGGAPVGMPGGVSTGGQAVSTSMQPPTPGTHPAQASTAAATAGTARAGESTFAGLAKFAASMKAVEIITDGVRAQLADVYQGQPLTLAGMFRTPLETISFGAMRPMIDQWESKERLARVAGASDLPRGTFSWADRLYGGTIDAVSDDMIRGTVLPKSVYQRSNEFKDPAVRKHFREAMSKALYHPEYVAAHGLPSLDDNLTLRDQRDALMTSAWDNPFAVASTLEGLGLREQAKRARGIGADRLTLDAKGKEAASVTALATARMSFASAFGDAADVAEAYGDVSASMSTEAQLIREGARRLPDGEQKRIMLNTAAQIDLQAKMQRATVFASEFGQSSAQAALQTARSGRAFDSALHSGKHYSDLPWDWRRNALLGDSKQTLAHRDRMVSEGFMKEGSRDWFELTDRAESLRHQATFALEAERGAMIGADLHLSAGADIAAFTGRNTNRLMMGSAGEQSGARLDEQIFALDRRKRALEEELRIRRDLTNEQRRSAQNEIASLEVQERRLAISRNVAVVMANLSTGQTASFETAGEAGRSLAFGAGGAAGGRHLDTIASEASKRRQGFESAIETLVNAGYSPDSQEILMLRGQAESARDVEAMLQVGRADVPMSARDRRTLTGLGTANMLIRAGLGGSNAQGLGRKNILGQMDVWKRRIGELNDRAGQLEREGGPGLDEQLARLESQKAEAAANLVNLQQQYDYGFLDRIISEAHNMPSQGRLFMARFTHREATLAGIEHPAFGGTRDQVMKHRNNPLRILGMLGGGSPDALTERAIGSADRRIQIDVVVKDQNGKFMGSGTGTLDDARVSATVTRNADAEKRPSG